MIFDEYWWKFDELLMNFYWSSSKVHHSPFIKVHQKFIKIHQKSIKFSAKFIKSSSKFTRTSQSFTSKTEVGSGTTPQVQVNQIHKYNLRPSQPKTVIQLRALFKADSGKSPQNLSITPEHLSHHLQLKRNFSYSQRWVSFPVDLLRSFIFFANLTGTTVITYMDISTAAQDTMLSSNQVFLKYNSKQSPTQSGWFLTANLTYSST